MKAPKIQDLLSISRILNAKSQTFSKSLIILPIFDAKLRKNRNRNRKSKTILDLEKKWKVH